MLLEKCFETDLILGGFPKTFTLLKKKKKKEYLQIKQNELWLYEK